MYKVRIKKACGGTHKKMQDGGYSDESMEANSYMGPVDREDANIEVEKGESAFGDINGDSFAELMFFGGKRHHSGGTPVNVPPGTFIFSDTAKLRIKDSELLEKFFNIKNPKKKGYTPAEISKQYKDFNKHMETIKDSTSDELAVGTAYEMINGIKDKLGALALIQESMKGFPDGIPSFAESAIAGLGMDPQELVQRMMPQEQQQPMQAPMGEMKYGGLPKAQNGKNWYDKDYKGSYKGQGFYGSKANYMDFITDLAGYGYDPETGKKTKVSSGTTMNADGKSYELTLDDAKDIWNSFLEAYETGDAKKISDVKEIFESLDAPGIGLWAWGTQDKLDDLAGILDERQEKVAHQKTVRTETVPEQQKAYRDHEAYLELLKLKQSLIPDEGIESVKLKAEIQNVENQLRPDKYKKYKYTDESQIPDRFGIDQVVGYEYTDRNTVLPFDERPKPSLYYETDYLQDFAVSNQGPIDAAKAVGLFIGDVVQGQGNQIDNTLHPWTQDYLKNKDYSSKYEALVNEINELQPGLNIKISGSSKTKPQEDIDNDVIYFNEITDYTKLKPSSTPSSSSGKTMTINGVEYKVGNF